MTGEIKYSNVVKVLITKGRTDIKVYPNPVVDGKIHVQMINQPSGIYTFKLMNGLGQTVILQDIDHDESNSVETIPVSRSTAHENYRLEITRPDKSKMSLNVLLR